jgi:membrane protein DedA with SNARE-associated domain
MPTDLNQILEVIREHGNLVYSFVFVWAVGNSLILVLLAGYAAHLGALDWGKLVTICWLGSFAGDAFRFWIGRRFGTKWLSSFPRIARAVQTIARMVEHHYPWLAFVYRYPNGIRSLAGFAFGISSVSTSTFLLLNFLSAGLWSLTTVSAGFALSHLTDKMVSDAASGLGMALLIGFVGLFWILGRRFERAIGKS